MDDPVGYGYWDVLKRIAKRKARVVVLTRKPEGAIRADERRTTLSRRGVLPSATKTSGRKSGDMHGTGGRSAHLISFGYRVRLDPAARYVSTQPRSASRNRHGRTVLRRPPAAATGARVLCPPGSMHEFRLARSGVVRHLGRHPGHRFTFVLGTSGAGRLDSGAIGLPAMGTCRVCAGADQYPTHAHNRLRDQPPAGLIFPARRTESPAIVSGFAASTPTRYNQTIGM
jgi:hypothetical protein